MLTAAIVTAASIALAPLVPQAAYLAGGTLLALSMPEAAREAARENILAAIAER